MHRHGAIPVVCEAYGAQVLGIEPGDRCLSAAKAFFAYGLGNSVLFPLSAGAASVLEPAPAKPDVIARWCSPMRTRPPPPGRSAVSSFARWPPQYSFPATRRPRAVPA
jgi:acyl-coenzyme A synthetase/AMP-(fatty) acid ligase